MARASSVNCLSCRIPYQCLHSLNAWTPFSEKALFFTDCCFVVSPFPNSVPKRRLAYSFCPGHPRAGVRDIPTCVANGPGLLQSPGFPKPRKCILKSEECHLDHTQKWPQMSIKMSKAPAFGHFSIPQKRAFWTFSLTFGPFFRGVQMAFLGL